MPIKKSYLEQKRYYRIAKVLFWIIPFLTVLATIFNGIDIPQGSIFYTVGYIMGWIGWRLQKDIVYIAIGLILYFLIVKIVWRTFLYIAFGGLENDTKKKNVVATQSVGPVVQPMPTPVSAPAPVQNTNTGPTMGIIFLIVIIGLIAIYFMRSSTTQERQINSGRKTSNSKCVPTGCGHLWNCTGDCYNGGVSVYINKCFTNSVDVHNYCESWSGKCRRCP